MNDHKQPDKQEAQTAGAPKDAVRQPPFRDANSSWHYLDCEFDEHSPPETLTFTPEDIIRKASRELWGPRSHGVVPYMRIRLQQVKVWAFPRDEEEAAVDLDVYPIPDPTPVPDPKHGSGTGARDGDATVANLRDFSTTGRNASCCFTCPPGVADHPLSVESDFALVGVSGDTQQTRFVQFRILWSMAPLTNGAKAPKMDGVVQLDHQKSGQLSDNLAKLSGTTLNSDKTAATTARDKDIGPNHQGGWHGKGFVDRSKSPSASPTPLK